MTTQVPCWGVNYDDGWAGFQFVDNNFISQGICVFERPERRSIPITVSHTFVVNSANTCIEAVEGGVVIGALAARLKDPHTHVFFRRPRGWTPQVGAQICLAAVAQVGERYGYGLIVAKALSLNPLGRLINRVTGDGFDRVLCAALDSSHTADCDKVVAKAMQTVPSLAKLGCLRLQARTLTPEILFEDNDVFE